MSRRSSSGSWSRSGTDAAQPPDIIDLDRYMRTARPHAHHARRDRDCSERLVVDGGGGGHNNKGGSSTCATSCTKRYSHDSGLSDDGSYGLRHRDACRRGATAREAPRATGSTHSMRNFRVACERALRDQQEQIARVAQLCDRLSALTTTHAPQISPPRSIAPHSSMSPDSSEFTSSSHTRSTRDQRRKDKTRTDECKTYKIIMTKLDELNRMFVARGRPPAQASGAAAAGAARRPRGAPAASSGSVSVSDKLVATENEPRLLPPRSHTPRPVIVRHIVVRAKGKKKEHQVTTRLVDRAVGESLPSSGTRLKEQRVTCFQLDLPKSCCVCRAQHDIIVDRLVKRSSSEEMASSVISGHGRTSSAVKDTAQIYAHSKRVQQAHRRTRSAESTWGIRRPRGEGTTTSSRDSGTDPSDKRARQDSLCRVCREYWRALTNCIAGQLYRPTTA